MTSDKGSIMKNFTIGLLFGALTCGSSYAADIYNGTLVDAHSQKGKLISSEEVSEHINKSDVDLTLLSFRGGHRKIFNTFLAIDEQTKNKVRFLLPTKLGGHSKGVPLPTVIERLKRFQNKAIDKDIEYAGFAEILVQHAPHDNKYLQWDGINYDLYNEGIGTIINFIIDDGKPVILHVELNDYEKDSKKILTQLIELSEKYPNTNFMLIHMGQVEFSEAVLIVNQTNNIHFITSLADNEVENRIKRMTKVSSQTGFINLFERDDSIQQKWVDLMNAHPKRFVLAVDRVFAGSWLKYKDKIHLWRKALAKLDKQSSVLIACGNANEYFKLEIECVSERSSK